MSASYTAVATANGRDGRAVSSDGRIDLDLAPPRELGGTGDGSNPEQLFAAGYAACFASALRGVARTTGQDVRDVSVTAEVTLKGDAQEGFNLSVVLRIELPDDMENGQELADGAHRSCPYSKATRGNIPVEIVLE